MLLSYGSRSISLFHVIKQGRTLVKIHVSSTVVEHFDRHSETVQEWLSRSAAYSLDISLGYQGSSTLDEFYDRIIDSLINFSERWRSVRFSAPHQALAKLVPVVTLPLSKVPLLEILSFDYFPGDPIPPYFTQVDPQSLWMTSGVLKAPKLRDLSLRCLERAQLNEDVTRLPINWSHWQLTSISLERFSWGASQSLTVSRAYKLLSLCRNLITCRLEIGSMMAHDEELSLDTTALISLPFLTKNFVYEQKTSLSRLFTLLYLPSLNCIEFYTAIEPTHHSSTSLLSLLTHFHNTTQLFIDTGFFT